MGARVLSARALAVATLLATGCYRPSARPCQLSCSNEGTCPDGLFCSAAGSCVAHPMDTCDVDAPSSNCTFHASTVDPCAIGALDATGTLSLSAITTDLMIDTGSPAGPFNPPAPAVGMVVTTTDGEVAVLEYRDVDLSGGHSIRVVGARPLVILANNDMMIDAPIVVSPTTAMVSPCGMGVLGSAPKGGGGGGGYGDRGGAGGSSGAATDASAAGGGFAGGVTIQPLRGGCHGSAGGAAVGVGGAGGLGGGAIQLSAAHMLTLGINGSVQAPGAGGRGVADTFGGAGGGGTGGSILIEAPLGTLAGKLCANGGAGGSTGLSAPPSVDGGCTAMPAQGTTGTYVGGAGGARGLPATAGASSTVGSTTGGGGGGGGVGRIRINGGLTDTAIVVESPLASHEGVP